MIDHNSCELAQRDLRTILRLRVLQQHDADDPDLQVIRHEHSALAEQIVLGLLAVLSGPHGRDVFDYSTDGPTLLPQSATRNLGRAGYTRITWHNYPLLGNTPPDIPGHRYFDAVVDSPDNVGLLGITLGYRAHSHEVSLGLAFRRRFAADEPYSELASYGYDLALLVFGTHAGGRLLGRRCVPQLREDGLLAYGVGHTPAAGALSIATTQISFGAAIGGEDNAEPLLSKLGPFLAAIAART